ncbi:serine/threonine protein kinase [Paenibacillus harenae]|uniref:serine/threonine protein kinase n=1 Tax=Paenibacillus harenae TaxID=306543 RepID=UPI0012EB8A4F|nr:serine/threonine-protein kinase [Paenibacillus harenae]
MNSQFSPFPILNKGDIVGGRYRVAGMIGRGGMGAVYAMEDLKLGGMLRAVKITRMPPDANHAFTDEAQMLMKLNHPHLPHLIDYFRMEEHGCDALVMDYFHGQTISSYYGGSYVRFHFSQIVYIGLQLCSALRYLHQQSPPIVHRDLKPSNVMIDGKGEVKLIDFGISRLYKEDGTQDTVQLGTVGFAAPEQAGGGQSDARTDIYGLGSLLYFMVTGGALFQHPDGSISARDQFKRAQTDMRPGLKPILERMLQAKPSNRYQTMGEAEEDLKQLALGNLETCNYAAEHRLKPSFHANLCFRICVVSIAPGAGATFLTLTMASLLAEAGLSVTAAEYGGLRPEWHALLTRQFQNRKAAAPENTAFDDRYFHFKQRDFDLNWFALEPSFKENPTIGGEGQKFEQMLRQSGSAVQLLDLSGKWGEPEAMQLLLQARIVLAVGDPAVYKWQASGLQKLASIQQELRQNGRSLIWAANKDVSFRGRNEWLSLFPVRPAAVIPHLPSADILNAHWNGDRLTGAAKSGKKLHQAMKPLMAAIYNEFNTK